MEIRPACDATKLNASQPLSGPNKSMTCTKPYSQSLTRSPEKDMISFSGNDKFVVSFALDKTDTKQFLKAVKRCSKNGKVTAQGLKKEISG